MTIAYSTLQTGFLEFIEAVAVVSTADATSDATKIVDAALSIYGDGYFDTWWAYITSGLAEGDIRQIETYTLVGTILDPYVDFSAAVANGDTYELHKHNPDSVMRAINDALVSLNNRPDPRTGRKNKLYRRIVFNDLGQDDLANNAAAAQAEVEISDDTLFFVGQKVTVKDDNASEDATIESIAAATNKLTMEDNLTNAYTTAASAEVIAKSGKYFNVGATLGNSRITGVFLQADSTSQRKPYREWSVVYTSAGVKQIYFPTAVSVDDQTWIVEAIGALEVVSAPASTVTIDSERVDLLYAEAAYHLYRRFSDDISVGDFERMEALSQRYKNMVDLDYRGLWLPLPRERISLTTDSDYDQEL